MYVHTLRTYEAMTGNNAKDGIRDIMSDVRQ